MPDEFFAAASATATIRVPYCSFRRSPAAIVPEVMIIRPQELSGAAPV